MTREQAHDFIYRRMVVHPNEGHLSANKRAEDMLNNLDSTGKNTQCILPNMNTLTVCKLPINQAVVFGDIYDVIETVGYPIIGGNYTAGTDPYPLQEEQPHKKTNRVLLLTK